jgi:hypothetical protein
LGGLARRSSNKAGLYRNDVAALSFVFV